MFASLIYIVAIVVANLLVAHFGPWFSPINAFMLIGLDLTLRDHLHDRWNGFQLWPRMLALIIVASLVSFVVNPSAGKIAVASVAAFCGAALVDAAFYHLVRRQTFILRANVSNAAGSLVDSLLFPAIAFGAFLPYIIVFQFVSKMLGGFLWSLLIHKFFRRSK